jgi:hypothetical protein
MQVTLNIEFVYEPIVLALILTVFFIKKNQNVMVIRYK